MSLSPVARRATLCFALGLASPVLIGPGLRGAETAPAAEAPPANAAEPEIEDVTTLPELEVRGARVEEFGFRFNVTISIPGTDTIIVSEVRPNTAAAKAGLRPGDRILKVDGKTPSVWSMAFKPNKIQERKWAELAAGKKSATLTLVVRAPETKEPRTLTLTIPSAAPRWGDLPWSAPQGRPPAVVPEAGPLAALARDVLDNGIWALGNGAPHPRLGYLWRIVEPGGTHGIWVTQQNGKTEITLEQRSPTTGQSRFLTSPSGALNEGSGATPKKKGEKRRKLTDEEVRARFAAEVDFWLHKVGRVTGRWPFEALPGATTVATGTAAVVAETRSPLAAAFQQLPAANAAQRALFLDALGKVGQDGEDWAYTETATGLFENHTTTVQIDPSRPPEEIITLLRVDGKNPKDADRKKWLGEGRVALPGLAELPPLSSVVDVNDVRVFADEPTAVVFELPVLALGEEFPADKFQARFRVNKTHRGFEDFAVKLREAMSVAGVAKVTDAGFEARFRVVDPALAPQPVWLKVGGGVRVVLVKVSRAIEVTRTDFRRVTPHEEPSAKPVE